MIFHLKDGTSLSVSANEKTVYKNGMAYALKGDNGEVFINISEENIRGNFLFS